MCRIVTLAGFDWTSETSLRGAWSDGMARVFDLDTISKQGLAKHSRTNMTAMKRFEHADMTLGLHKVS